MMRRLVLLTLIAIVAATVGVPLLAAFISSARAAAILNMNGQRIVVLTAEEFIAAMQAKDAEIARLTDALDAKRKVDCDLI